MSNINLNIKPNIHPNISSRKVLGSGAEATVYLDDNIVDKERSKKNYRHEDIDLTLRKARTKKESKILKALEPYGFAPKLLKQTDYNIDMEYIDGIQLKKLLDKNPELASLIGKNLTIMHDLNLIHGDLTTSNMILVSDDVAYKEFLKGYTPFDKKEILERLDIVEQRGRYKEKT